MVLIRGGSGPFAHLTADLQTRFTGRGTHFKYLLADSSCRNRGVGGELSSEISFMGRSEVREDSMMGSSGCSSSR